MSITFFLKIEMVVTKFMANNFPKYIQSLFLQVSGIEI